MNTQDEKQDNFDINDFLISTYKENESDKKYNRKPDVALGTSKDQSFHENHINMVLIGLYDNNKVNHDMFDEKIHDMETAGVRSKINMEEKIEIAKEMLDSIRDSNIDRKIVNTTEKIINRMENIEEGGSININKHNQDMSKFFDFFIAPSLGNGKRDIEKLPDIGYESALGDTKISKEQTINEIFITQDRADKFFNLISNDYTDPDLTVSRRDILLDNKSIRDVHGEKEHIARLISYEGNRTESENELLRDSFYFLDSRQKEDIGINNRNIEDLKVSECVEAGKAMLSSNTDKLISKVESYVEAEKEIRKPIPEKQKFNNIDFEM